MIPPQDITEYPSWQNSMSDRFVNWTWERMMDKTEFEFAPINKDNMIIKYPPHYVEKLRGKQKYPWAIKQNGVVVCAFPKEKWAIQFCNIINDYMMHYMPEEPKEDTKG